MQPGTYEIFRKMKFSQVPLDSLEPYSTACQPQLIIRSPVPTNILGSHDYPSFLRLTSHLPRCAGAQERATCLERGIEETRAKVAADLKTFPTCAQRRLLLNWTKQQNQIANSTKRFAISYG